LRLRADIFVAAYLRRCAANHVPAVLRRRGSEEAGAIYVSVDRPDGTAALFAPAADAASKDPAVERVWRRAHREEWIPSGRLSERMSREIAIDPDLWWVEVEDSAAGHGLDLADE